MTRERIEDMREVVLPFVKKRLLETNYETLGKSDAEEFTRDFNEILNLAIKALEQEPTTKNDCAEQNGCITCSLDDGDDCCRKLYEESMQEPTAKNDLGVDCISREVVLDVIEREQFKGDAISEIEKLPPVTPQPRKGHWMGKGDFITCSCCNEMSYPFESSGYGSIYHNYCPNCGADMREVKNGL